MELFEHLVMEPLKHSVPVTTLDVRLLLELSVWEPLEHSDHVVTVHVYLDSLWMAPWDAGGTLGGGCWPGWLSGELRCVQWFDYPAGRCFSIRIIRDCFGASDGYVF